MAEKIEKILVPDIGGAENVDVIEVHVKPGDKIAVDDPIVTLESEKASLDVPATLSGIVEKVSVKIGDKVSEGHVLLTVKTAGAEKSIEKTETPKASKHEEKPAPKTADKTVAKVENVMVPDIGGAEKVDVIEVHVKPGDNVAADDPIITLESEKASLDVPAPKAGIVEKIAIKVGNKVSEGDLILTLKTQGGEQHPMTSKPGAAATTPKSSMQPPQKLSVEEDEEEEDEEKVEFDTGGVHAGPAVRRIAREFGVDLTKVRATGPRGRILKEDMQNYVKQQLRVAEKGGGGLSISAAPSIDFSKFGEIETKALPKIKKITGVNLHRNWVSIPHVTQFADADITEMEAFREKNKEFAAAQGFKLTPIVFIMKAVVSALKQYPTFNASLDQSGENLIYKKYFHVGVAVDTPNGLVVPVIRDVDKKSVFDLAKELGEISKKARDKGIGLADMQGGCFTISSLGGIGGTAFTPIINAPEVAILGVSKSEYKPVYHADTRKFEPRLMLPLSLSYDHRVIDGAEGARFITYLANCLLDLRTLLL